MSFNTPDVKSKKHAVVMLVAGVTIAITYKIWKYFLRNYLGMDPNEDYLEYEIYNTAFRALSSVLGIGFCAWGFNEIKSFLLGQDQKMKWIMFAYLILYFLIVNYKNSILGAQNFDIELAFNFFTGVSEEFVFRGMIFSSLRILIGFWPSAIASAAFFLPGISMSQAFLSILLLYFLLLLFFRSHFLRAPE